MNRTGRAAAAAAMAVTLTGCTPSPPSDAQQLFDRAVIPDNQVRLGDAVMAFFVGPQIDEMSWAFGQIHNPGYLVLVNADGAIRAVKTKRMDTLSPAWSDHGLYFADESDDYHLAASGLTKTRNPKVKAQNLMFALPAGGSVGVYNGGDDSDGGYANQVGVSAGHDARAFNVQGNYFTGALCGSQIYGLTSTPGTHTRTAARPSDRTSAVDSAAKPEMLARLYPLSADNHEKVIGWRPFGGSSIPGGQVPCHDGVITYVSWEVDSGGGEQPKVISWDTSTGEHRARPLIFDDGTRLDSDEFDFVPQDWHHGRLQWVTDNGRAFSTDPTTGRTTAMYDASLDDKVDGRPSTTHLAYSATRLHALTTFRHSDSGITYTIFDRADGKILRRVSLPIPNAKINISDLNLARMTVNPKV